MKTFLTFRFFRGHSVYGIIPALVLLTACGGGSGGGGAPAPVPVTRSAVSTAAAIEDILPGTDSECPQGGVLVKTGIDENGNGLLDDAEVDDTRKVCHGTSTLVSMNDEPVGANCPFGGLRLDSGPDINGNGMLDPGEIQSTEFVCAGNDSRVGWEPATRLRHRGAPVLAANGIGNVAAAMLNYPLVSLPGGVAVDENYPTSIYGYIHYPGRGWKGMFIQSLAAGNTVFRESLRMGLTDDPYILVAWLEDVDGDGRMEFMTSERQGGSSASAMQLNGASASVSSDNRSHDLAVNGAGDGLAAWFVENNTRLVVRHRDPDPTVGWGSVVTTVDTVSPPGRFEHIRVVMDEHGRGMAVWFRGVMRGDLMVEDVAVYASRFDPASSPAWSPPVAISPVFEVGMARYSNEWLLDRMILEVETDDAGNVHVAWWRPGPADASAYSVYEYVKFDAAANTWGSVESVWQVNDRLDDDYPNFQLVPGRIGDVALLSVVKGEAAIRFRLQGGTWSSPEKPPVTPVYGWAQAFMAWLGNTNDLLWVAHDGRQVVASRFNARVGWLRPVEMYAFDQAVDRDLMLTLSHIVEDADGNVVVAWGWSVPVLVPAGPSGTAELRFVNMSALQRYRLVP